MTDGCGSSSEPARQPPASVYLQYRGKAQPDAAAIFAWHPVAYHCLDVAACAGALLDARPATLRHGASLLRLQPDDARRLVVSLAALHDIGKFSESFFGQAAELWPSLHGEYASDITRGDHTVAGYLLWQDVLLERFGDRMMSGSRHHLEALAVATFGHHGKPLARGTRVDKVRHFGLTGTREAATEFAEDAIALLCPAPVVPREEGENSSELASWWIAGLLSVSDWLASNQNAFPYGPPTLDVRAYYTSVALDRATEAVRRAGLRSPVIAAARSFRELTGKAHPTPAQRWAADVALPPGPVLCIIEDSTGTGKTEAAQVLIHRLMTDGRASGAYWGMPTQATANAMYNRQRNTIHALFGDAGDRPPSLIVAHSSSRLHDDFRNTVFDGWAGKGLVADDDDEGSDGAIACAAFIADDRRTGFLADVGAGTIDQALLAVLPSRFNTIRLFGLAEKVLVLDEVHAYDAYVETEIEALLEFQVALGGSAILLSATLTQRQRDRFAAAWQRGSRVTPARSGWVVDRPDEAPTDPTSVPYPLATVVPTGRPVASHPLAAAARSVRTVELVNVHDEAEVVRRIRAAFDGGLAVAWIRNTVDSAIAGSELLRDVGIEPLVFHARFAQCDRQRRESEVTTTYGFHSSGRARNRVLVATQVVEQSLDLDFDLVISDLAPIDLLVQRAGRLWRHERVRPAVARPELHVLAPPFDPDPGDRWLDAVLPKTRFVYEDLGVLWRTQRELAHAGAIVSPSGIRALVEGVYSDADVPESLEAASLRARGKSAALKMTARQYALDVATGYAAGCSTGWYADIRVPTRLGEENTVIRLARLDGGRVVPWCTEYDGWRGWALSEVRVSERKVGRDSRLTDCHAAAVNGVRATWPKYEREVLVVVLEAVGNEWGGEYVDTDGEVRRVTYSSDSGLRL